MPALQDVVSVNITSVSANPTQSGFGVTLILDSTNTATVYPWADMVREYTGLTGGVDADFPVASPVYKAAAKFFSQNPRPERVLVGKGAGKPTQRWTITPTPANLYTYALTVNGTRVTYTSDSTAAAAEITAGLKTAIDALGLAITVTAAATLVITANVAGAWFSVGNTDAKLSLVQDHADVSTASDLAAINQIRSDWFGLVTLHNSSAVVVAAAAWANANGKQYAAQTQDTPVIDVASGSDTTSVATLLKTANGDGSLWFSGDNSDFLDAGVMGARSPYTPGDETWKFANVTNVPVGTYTATQRANMAAKSCNYFEPTQGVPMTTEGVTCSGKYIDLVRFLAYLQSRIGTRVFGRLAALPKVPYGDDGIQVVEAEVRGQMQEDEKRGAILPGWTVSVPKAASATADRGTRMLRNVTFSCVYSGAIHKVLVNGSVSV